MLSRQQPKSLVIKESKIVHKSWIVHPLARFVTEETAAMLCNIDEEEIYKISCWRYVVHVHGKGVSRFVSYADFPAILAINPPTPEDFALWRKRWRTNSKSKQAPEFWTKFYKQQFQKAESPGNLLCWGKLVALVKQVMSSEALQRLREVYKREKYAWQHF